MGSDPSDDRPAKTTGPLSGIRVIDFTRVVAGPLCGRLLSDQGADVIKVEPLSPDMTRAAPPLVGGFSAYFAHFNAGKRGVSVDLGDPEAAAAVMTMVEGADVLIENFRPGVLSRFGLGAQDALRHNPRLVYCSISGYGQHGEWANRRCFAPVVHGESGLLASSARLSSSEVRPEPHSHADIQAAYLASMAISSALFDRERTGKGSHLDISLAEASVYSNEFTGPELSGQTGAAYYGGSACLVLTLGDGSMATTQGNPANTFKDWLAAMGRHELKSDDRFRRHADRLNHRAEIDEIILQWALTVPDFESLHEIVDPHGLAIGLVRNLTDLAETSWAKQRGLIAEPIAGLRHARVPYRSSQHQIGASGPPPERGEHNESVFVELADKTPEQVAAMTDRGALETAPDGAS